MCHALFISASGDCDRRLFLFLQLTSTAHSIDTSLPVFVNYENVGISLLSWKQAYKYIMLHLLPVTGPYLVSHSSLRQTAPAPKTLDKRWNFAAFSHASRVASFSKLPSWISDFRLLTYLLPIIISITPMEFPYLNSREVAVATVFLANVKLQMHSIWYRSAILGFTTPGVKICNLLRQRLSQQCHGTQVGPEMVDPSKGGPESCMLYAVRNSHLFTTSGFKPPFWLTGGC